MTNEIAISVIRDLLHGECRCIDALACEDGEESRELLHESEETAEAFRVAIHALGGTVDPGGWKEEAANEEHP